MTMASDANNSITGEISANNQIALASVTIKANKTKANDEIDPTSIFFSTSSFSNFPSEDDDETDPLYIESNSSYSSIPSEAEAMDNLIGHRSNCRPPTRLTKQ